MSTALLLLAAVASGPSFDCTRARSTIEHAICGSTELAELDREEARLYRMALDRAPAQHAELVARQRSFLHDREECDDSHLDLNECLRDAYFDDIADLRRVGGLTDDTAGLSFGPQRFHCDDGFPDAYLTRFSLATAQAAINVPTQDESQSLVASGLGGRLIGRGDDSWSYDPATDRMTIGARICTPAR